MDLAQSQDCCVADLQTDKFPVCEESAAGLNRLRKKSCVDLAWVVRRFSAASKSFIFCHPEAAFQPPRDLLFGLFRSLFRLTVPHTPSIFVIPGGLHRLRKNSLPSSFVSGHDFSRAECRLLLIRRADFGPRGLCLSDFFSNL